MQTVGIAVGIFISGLAAALPMRVMVGPLAFCGAFVCATVDWYGDGPDAAATLNLTWTARILSGEPSAADDVAELRWFAADELPGPGELAFEHTPDVLEAWRLLRAE